MFVRIVPAGNIAPKILELVCAGLEEVLNSRCRILQKVQIPKEAWDHWRRQYDAEKILESLVDTGAAKFIDKSIPTIGITDEDIYYKGLNFVFGLEEPATGCCIVSIARLKQEFYGQSSNMGLLVDRTVKEVIHQIGHLFDLSHCQYPTCVMCFSPSVNDVDNKQKYFCDNCKIKIARKGIRMSD